MIETSLAEATFAVPAAVPLILLLLIGLALGAVVLLIERSWRAHRVVEKDDPALAAARRAAEEEADPSPSPSRIGWR